MIKEKIYNDSLQVTLKFNIEEEEDIIHVLLNGSTIWIDGKGKRYYPENLSSRHLINVIFYLKNNAETIHRQVTLFALDAIEEWKEDKLQRKSARWWTSYTEKAEDKMLDCITNESLVPMRDLLGIIAENEADRKQFYRYIREAETYEDKVELVCRAMKKVMGKFSERDSLQWLTETELFKALNQEVENRGLGDIIWNLSRNSNNDYEDLDYYSVLDLPYYLL